MEFNLIEIIIGLVLLFFSVVVHECAHGWVAEKCGDPTARLLGRITLNPIKHVDPVGTLILPIMLKLMGAPIFGWAKPVPVNYYNLRHPRKDMIWVAAAGPISNIILASVAIGILVLFYRLSGVMSFGFLHYISNLGVSFISINVLLATFNMLPIPPLDGSRILSGLLPTELAIQYSKLEPYGFLIIFGLIYLKAFNWIFNIVFGITGSLLSIVLGV